MKSEKHLLKRARTLDQHVLAEIYDRYSPKIYAYAVRMLGDDIRAEGCVTETFNRFLTALRQGSGPKAHLQAYLYRISHHLITEQLRCESTLSLDSGGSGDTVSDLSPREDALNAPMQGRVSEALRAISPDQRQVILLKYLEGWSNAEVAKAIDKPVDAVKSLHNRGLGALQRLLVQEVSV